MLFLHKTLHSEAVLGRFARIWAFLISQKFRWCFLDPL